MKSSSLPQIIAFDYGSQHIGLAYNQEFLVEPLQTISHFTEIQPFIDRFKPDLLLVGLPSTGPMVKAVKAFAQRLKQTFSLPVILHPEDFSTHEALQRLRQSQASRRKLKNDHPYAAAIILEDYLESLS